MTNPNYWMNRNNAEAIQTEAGEVLADVIYFLLGGTYDGESITSWSKYFTSGCIAVNILWGFNYRG